MSALKETNFSFKNQTGFYQGKVRDVYYFGDRMAVVASDRISAFDVILPRAIPYKGQVLNQIAARFLEQTADIVPNWLLQVPHPNLSIGIRCEPYPVEMVVRGYLTGHAWRVYKSGRRELCGVQLPEGLKENDKLPHPVITPTTKAKEGHDEDISGAEIVAGGMVAASEYRKLEEFALALFERGTHLAATKGLILVDTKYEFGRLGNRIYLIDEVHTPDSSRYFYEESYSRNQEAGRPQKHLSKEFVREWLISHGFQGQQGQSVPDMDDNRVKIISERYIELFEQVTGEKFLKTEYGDTEKRIETSILACMSGL